MKKIIDFLSSLRLAVFVILSLAVVSAVGTIYEAKYDSEYAQMIVYHSIYMYTVLGLLCVNLIFVMIDRWPWKRRHIGFIMAHVGIILTLVGAYVTRKVGVDGTISFPIGQHNRYVTVGDREIVVYSSFAGGQPVRMFQSGTDFFNHDPEKYPMLIPLGQDQIKVVKYDHYALREERFVKSINVHSGPAIRFQLQNSRVNLTDWIYKPRSKQSEKIKLGPADIVLTQDKYEYKGGNVIVFRPRGDAGIDYAIYLDRKKGMIGKGRIHPGESLPTGWMDIQLRLLNYYPQAEQAITYTHVEKPSALTMSAIKLQFDGKTHWLGLNSLIKLFTKDKVYYVTYGNRRIDLGFDMKLTDFRVGRYQGTQRASSYESDVQVNGGKPVTISMNHPLKQSGYTFYQSSFDQDKMGRPTISVLSVNKDPGRPIKYIGSLMVVLGSIILFYFRRMKMLDYFTKNKK